MKIVLAILFALAVVASYYLLTNVDGFLRFGPGAGDNEPASVPVLKVIGTVIAMLFGIVFGSLHDQMLERTRVSIVKEISRLRSSPRMFRALLASPVLYVGVYMAAKTQPDLVISLMFAFQTGFFCNAIMKKKAAAAG